MNILAMANESTFVAHRKYFHRPSQVLSFLAGISIKKGVSGFFRLVTPYVRNKVVPLPYGTDQATTCHSSGCAYRQLRCCKF